MTAATTIASSLKPRKSFFLTLPCIRCILFSMKVLLQPVPFRAYVSTRPPGAVSVPWPRTVDYGVTDVTQSGTMLRNCRDVSAEHKMMLPSFKASAAAQARDVA